MSATTLASISKIAQGGVNDLLALVGLVEADTRSQVSKAAPAGIKRCLFFGICAAAFIESNEFFVKYDTSSKSDTSSY